MKLSKGTITQLVKNLTIVGKNNVVILNFFEKFPIIYK